MSDPKTDDQKRKNARRVIELLGRGTHRDEDTDGAQPSSAQGSADMNRMMIDARARKARLAEGGPEVV